MRQVQLDVGFALLDTSVRILLPALVAVLAMKMLRVREANLRHRIWSGVLAGMLLIPLLSLLLPSVMIPVLPALAGSSWIESSPASEPDVTPVKVADVHHPLASITDQSLPNVGTSRNPLIEKQPSPIVPQASESTPFDAAATSEATIAAARLTSVAPSEPLATSSVSRSLATALWLAWACVAVVFLLRLFVGTFTTRRLVSTAISIRDAIRIPAEFAANRQILDVKSTNAVAVPVTIGWLRPTVVLPDNYREWSTEKLQAVLTHELTHVVRHDFAIAMLAELNRCLYWFHPLAWWLRRQLSDLAEESCDDAVIGQTQNAPKYARVLLEVAASMLERRGRVTSLGLSMARSSNVERRIAVILDDTRPLSTQLSRRRIIALALIGTFVIGLTSMLQPAGAELKDKPQAEQRQQAAPPLKQQSKADAKPTSLEIPPGAHRFGGMVWEGVRMPVPEAAGANQGQPQPLVEPPKALPSLPAVEGKPLANATIHLCKVTFKKLYASRHEVEILQTFHTNAQGRYEGYVPAEHVPVLHRKDPTEPLLALTVTAPGYASESNSALAENWRQGMNFTLTLGTSIVGTIIDVEGQPVAGARIVVREHLRSNPGSLDRWLKTTSHEPPSADETERMMMITGPRDLEAQFPGEATLFAPLGAAQPPITDQNGKFKLQGVGPNDMVLLDIEGEGITKTTLHVLGRDMESVYGAPHANFSSHNARYYGRNFTYVAQPSVPVYGVVRDLDTQAPLPGVTVAVSGVFGSRMTQDGYTITTTDEQGRYRIEGLPLVPTGVRKYEHNRFSIRPVGLNYFENDRLPVPRSVDSRTPIEFNIELKKAVVVRGRVLNKETGVPVQGGAYYTPFHTNKFLGPYPQFTDGVRTLLGNSTPYHTDKEGWFEIPVTPGRGVIAIQCDSKDFRTSYGAAEIPEYQNFQEPSNIGELSPGHIVPSLFHSLKAIDVPENASTFSVDLNVDPGQSLKVHFVDPSSQPVSGVTVKGLASESRPVTVDTTESMATGLGIGDLRPMIVQHEQRGLFRMVRLVPEEGQTDFTVQLLPPTVLTGRLVAKSGKPISGAPMEARHNVDPQMGSALYPGQKTDAEGRFEWKLPVGTPYTIIALGDKVITVVKDFDVQEPLHVDLGDLIVDPDAEQWASPKPQREPITKPLPQ